MDDVQKTVEYDGRSWKVNRVIAGTGEHITLNLEAVPELPEEPPVGETLFDDRGRPHYHYSTKGWIDIFGNVRPWQKLLAYSDMRRCLVAGKATDYLIRFKGTPPRGAIVRAIGHRAPARNYCSGGHTTMEAPVHGYFEKVEE